MFKRYRIQVVFIDAAHNYPSVKSDAVMALHMDTVQWIVFHDYWMRNELVGISHGNQVQLVVDELVKDGFLNCGVGVPPLPATFCVFCGPLLHRLFERPFVAQLGRPTSPTLVSHPTSQEEG